MTYHFLKTESGAITYSNWPFSENGISSTPFDISAEWLEVVQEGEKDFVLEDGQLTLVDSQRKAHADNFKAQVAQEAEELKQAKDEFLDKMEKGEATQEDKDQMLITLLKKL